MCVKLVYGIHFYILMMTKSVRLYFVPCCGQVPAILSVGYELLGLESALYLEPGDSRLAEKYTLL